MPKWRLNFKEPIVADELRERIEWRSLTRTFHEAGREEAEARARGFLERGKISCGEKIYKRQRVSLRKVT